MATIILLLAVPLAAMRFTPEVRWTPLDFTAAAALLGGGAITCELAIRHLRGRARIVVCGVMLSAALLLWAQGAVGIV